MPVSIPASTLEKFTTFGDLLRFLRRRLDITQTELSIAVGYSTAQISRLEQNLRLPDLPTIEARFVPALDLENDPRAVARLLELAARVRREDAPASGLCPYKGLNYFDEADADWFVGREALTSKLTERVLSLSSVHAPNGQRFLAIVGASGSGKSSLVRAGLVSSLRWNPTSADWQIYVLTPNAHPLESLTESLNQGEDPSSTTGTFMNDWGVDAHGLHLFARQKLGTDKDSRLLLVVDQFEELFTLCHSEEERAAFIGSLLTAASEPEGLVMVVITLRADFYAQCADYPQLREALAQHQEYIGAMTREELCRTIEEPARRGHWEIEPGLVELLLHDIGQEPGALPLLSHALLETWQRRRGRTMTLSGYASSGGVRGAIAATAEAVFTDQFTSEQRAIARRIFLRLTELGTETAIGDTRRRATFDELILKPEEAAATQAVLVALADARLITTHEGSAEVAHEALIREWPTLRNWLEENRESLRFHRQLTEDAQEWLASNREVDLLYRGARLAQLREWSSGHADEMNLLEGEFLAVSLEQSEREIAEREGQRQRELLAAQKLAETQSRAAKQLKRRALFLAGAFSLAIVLATLASFFWKAANQNELKAQSREIAAAAIASLADDPERSILLALQALNTSHTVEAENALHRSILESRLRFALQHDAEVWSVAFSPDSKRIGTASQDKTAKIWDVDTGKLLLTLNHDDSANGIVFSPDGKWIATTSDDGTAHVWDSMTGKRLLTFSGHTSYALRIAFSPDGTRLATTSYDETARVWDAATGQEYLMVTRKGEIFYDVAFSPDGKRFVTSNQDNNTLESNIRIWDAMTGKELLTIPIHGGIPRGLALSPDGTRVAGTGAALPNGLLWDARCAELYAQGSCQVNGEALSNGMIADIATGKVLWNGLPDPRYGILDIAFSPDGRLVLNAGFDQKARVWDIATGQVLYTLSGHVNPIHGVAYSPDGTHVATASWDYTARVWDLTPGKESLFIRMPSHGSNLMISSPDGSQILSPDLQANGIIIQDGSSGEERFTLKSTAGKITGAIFSQDGKRVAAACDDGEFLVWDIKTGKQVAALTAYSNVPTAEVFSPDGSQLAGGYLNGEIVIWNLESGKLLQTLQGPTPNPDPNLSVNQISSLTYSPDGTRLISGDINGLGIVWDLKTGEQVMTLTQEGEGDAQTKAITGFAYSPDGRYIALASGREFASVFEASTGKLFLILKGHSAGIRSISFSPDGQRIATSSLDGTTRLWDATTGENLLMLPVAGQASFLQEGKELAIGTESGLYGFVLPLDDLIALAKSRLTRTLTTDECQQYLHVDSCPGQP